MREKNYRIYWHKKLAKFMVNVRYKGENIHVGYYQTMPEALEARNKAFESLGIIHSSTEVIHAKKSTRYELLCKNLKDDNISLGELANKPNKSLEDII